MIDANRSLIITLKFYKLNAPYSCYHGYAADQGIASFPPQIIPLKFAGDVLFRSRITNRNEESQHQNRYFLKNWRRKDVGEVTTNANQY